MELIEQYFNVYLASLIMWGFLMAFLYNVVKKSSSPGSDPTVMWIALSIFLSYLLSDPLFNQGFGYDLLDSTSAYLVWSVFDLVTILVIMLIARGKTVQKSPVKLYLCMGLMINISLFIGMYIDLNFTKYIGPWWFWYFYSIIVNISDITMIIALLCNKDFLGLVSCYNYLKGLNKHQALFSKT